MEYAKIDTLFWVECDPPYDGECVVEEMHIIHLFKKDGLWHAHDEYCHTSHGMTPTEAAENLLEYLAKEHQFIFGELEFVSEPREEGSAAARAPMPARRTISFPPSIN